LIRLYACKTEQSAKRASSQMGVLRKLSTVCVRRVRSADAIKAFRPLFCSRELSTLFGGWWASVHVEVGRRVWCLFREGGREHRSGTLHHPPLHHPTTDTLATIGRDRKKAWWPPRAILRRDVNDRCTVVPLYQRLLEYQYIIIPCRSKI